MQLPFESKAHSVFFYSCLRKAQREDPYHQALFYTMGISEITRENVSQWFDFEKDHIIPNALDADWQTGGTRRLTRLAFNLWNDFNDGNVTPYDLFDCSYGKYMLESISLLYPEYCRLPEIQHKNHTR